MGLTELIGYCKRGGPVMPWLIGLAFLVCLLFFYTRLRLAKILAWGIWKETESVPEISGPKDLVIDLGLSLERLLVSLRVNLNILEILTAVAPLLGLLGTVRGLILTFSGFSLNHPVALKTVSAGVGTALITTQLGLFISVFGLMGIWWIGVELEKLQNHREGYRLGSRLGKERG